MYGLRCLRLFKIIENVQKPSFIVALRLKEWTFSYFIRFSMSIYCSNSNLNNKETYKWGKIWHSECLLNSHSVDWAWNYRNKHNLSRISKLTRLQKIAVQVTTFSKYLLFLLEQKYLISPRSCMKLKITLAHKNLNHVSPNSILTVT